MAPPFSEPLPVPLGAKVATDTPNGPCPCPIGGTQRERVELPAALSCRAEPSRPPSSPRAWTRADDRALLACVRSLRSRGGSLKDLGSHFARLLAGLPSTTSALLNSSPTLPSGGRGKVRGFRDIVLICGACGADKHVTSSHRTSALSLPSWHRFRVPASVIWDPRWSRWLMYYTCIDYGGPPPAFHLLLCGASSPSGAAGTETGSVRSGWAVARRSCRTSSSTVRSRAKRAICCRSWSTPMTGLYGSSGSRLTRIFASPSPRKACYS